MQGFFKSVKDSLPVGQCYICKLDQECQSPKMELSGEGKKGILVVGEAPGRAEDREGSQFIGKTGQYLRKVLSSIAIDLDEDCWKINAVNCFPLKNKTPSSNEVAYCRPRLWEQIEKKNPKVIVLLGKIALESFLGDRWREGLGGISRWRGFIIPDRKSESWVIPSFHPSYILRQRETNPAVELIFKDDMKKINHVLYDRGTVEKEKPEQDCITVLNKDNLPLALKRMYQGCRKNKRLLAFDYETTGLKPYAEGHKIVSVSLCFDRAVAYAFMTSSFDSISLKYWKMMLECPTIPKTAHNLKFEHVWSKQYFGVDVKGWKWDTMNIAHLIDNRSYISGLEFQAYMNFGLEPWNEKVSSFLKARGGNNLNTIQKVPNRELLLYNGIDSLIQYKLAILQGANQ